MKKLLKIMMGTMLMTLFFGMQVFAAEVEDVAPETEQVQAEQTQDKPVVALGADLTAEQRAEVLSLMGIAESDLANYTVIYITNADEHKYLDSYIDPSVIGTKALSSVIVFPKEAGHGVVVTTKNITYCTTGMYRNALLTAGVENADILVVGPTQLSGTAGLIGAIKAYEQVSGEVVSDETLDVALNELVSTGEIAEDAGNSDDVEALIAYIKGKIAAGELETEDDIKKAIEEAQDKFNVTLNDSEIQKIVSLMMKINKLGIDPTFLADQAKDLYDKFGEEFFTSGEAEKLLDKILDFFGGIGDFFKNLFG